MCCQEKKTDCVKFQKDLQHLLAVVDIHKNRMKSRKKHTYREKTSLLKDEILKYFEKKETELVEVSKMGFQ